MTVAALRDDWPMVQIRYRRQCDDCFGYGKGRFWVMFCVAYAEGRTQRYSVED